MGKSLSSKHMKYGSLVLVILVVGVAVGLIIHYTRSSSSSDTPPYVPAGPQISSMLTTKTASLPFGPPTNSVTDPIYISGLLVSLSLTLTPTAAGFTSYLVGPPQRMLYVTAVITTPTTKYNHVIYQNNTYTLTDQFITLTHLDPLAVASAINNSITISGANLNAYTSNIKFMVTYVIPNVTKPIELPANVNCSYSYYPLIVT